MLVPVCDLWAVKTCWRWKHPWRSFEPGQFHVVEPAILQPQCEPEDLFGPDLLDRHCAHRGFAEALRSFRSGRVHAKVDTRTTAATGGHYRTRSDLTTQRG